VCRRIHRKTRADPKNGRRVQFIGLEVQFVGRTRTSEAPLVTIKIAVCKITVASAIPSSGSNYTFDFSRPSTAAVRQDLALDVADQFGYVVSEVEVMTGESP
jgi:hypothetical protein